MVVQQPNGTSTPSSFELPYRCANKGNKGAKKNQGRDQHDPYEFTFLRPSVRRLSQLADWPSPLGIGGVRPDQGDSARLRREAVERGGGGAEVLLA
jgi:hypothetical protein